MAAGDFISATIPSDSGASKIVGGLIDLVFSGMNTGGTFQFDQANNTQTNGSNTWNVCKDTSTAFGVLTVVSKGFDATGAATTITRKVYITRAFRLANPSQATPVWSNDGTNTTIRCVLSDPIFAKDKTGAGNSGTNPTITLTAGLYTKSGVQSAAVTNGAVTNNSVAAYQKPLFHWYMPDHQRYTADFTKRMIVDSDYGVAAIVQTTQDGHSNSDAKTVATPVSVLRTVTNQYSEEYQATHTIGPG